MKYYFGIDLGGTTAKAAIVNQRQQIVRDFTVATDGFPNPQDVVRKIANVGRVFLRQMNIRKIGVGVAGDINFERGLVRISPNLNWKNVPLRALFERAFKTTVIVDNDANAAAWGIYKTQAPARVKNLIALTLGTGVGGGMVINGELHRGATGSAGEVGHMCLEPKGQVCNCGNQGCLEAYVGGVYLTRRLRHDLKRGVKSSLQALFRRNPALVSPRSLAEAGKNGDRYALSIWQEVGCRLGQALGNLIYLLNPEMIVFSGGITGAGDLFMAPLRRTLNERTFHTPIRAARIAIAKRPAHMGVIGAALL